MLLKCHTRRFHELLFDLAGPAANFHKYPLEQIIKAFWSWDNVERGRDGAALLEVRYPQLATSELPFHVGLFL